MGLLVIIGIVVIIIFCVTKRNEEADNTIKHAEEIIRRNLDGDKEAVAEWERLRNTVPESVLDRVRHMALIERAESGDSESMYSLGIDFGRGYGCEKDIKKAKYWDLKAANLNNIDAIKRLADLYSLGEGYEYNYYEKNEDEAIKWYKKGTDLGSEECQVELGLMYLYSKLEKRDEGIRLLTAAAEKGNVKAMENLATSAFDKEKAVYWYSMASQYGSEYANTMKKVLGGEENS